MKTKGFKKKIKKINKNSRMRNYRFEIAGKAKESDNTNKKGNNCGVVSYLRDQGDHNAVVQRSPNQFDQSQRNLVY